MEKEDKKAGSRSRYVWDPDKLAWVEKVEELPKEAPRVKEEPTRREEIARPEKVIPQAEPVRQNTVTEPVAQGDMADVAVEAEVYEEEYGARFLEYKGALLRVVAVIIDVIILSIVGVIIGTIVRAVGPDQLPRAFGAINIVLGFAYFVGFWLWRGQTPGKMIIGARVARAGGSPVGFTAAVLRYIFYLIPTFAPLLFLAGFFGLPTLIQLVIPLLSLIVVGLVAKKRGIHDMIAGTVVINTRSRMVQSYVASDSQESEAGQQSES